MALVLLVGLTYELEATVARALTAHGYDVTAVRDAPQALAAIQQSVPSLAILNTDLPGHDGFHLCSEIRALPPARDTMVVFVTHRDSLLDKLNGFAAGTDDYITIPFHMPELLLRVEALLRWAARLAAGRERLWPAAETRAPQRYGPLILDRQTGEVQLLGRQVTLTPVEARLLDYLINSAGRPVSAEELLRHVWHQAPGTGDPALVRMHVRHLRKKLESSPTAPTLLKTMPRFGYCLAQDGIP